MKFVKSNINQNRIIAFLVFLIALIIYGKTVAPTTSFWDCGEFISAAYTMGVPHPPGAPLFILLGRIMTLLPFVKDIGLRVNLFSVFVSALTIMVTYLIIVRLTQEWKEKNKEKLANPIIFAGAIMGALALAFTDSFWFSAVEAEVYAFSMFFTAIVIWLILVWLDHADHITGDKILLLIAYLIGLAVGVHLLNVLTLPTVFLIIYFKKETLRISSFSMFAALACLAIGLVYPGMVKGLPSLIKHYSFGVIFLIIAVLGLGIYYAAQHHKRILHLFLMSTTLLMLGYSTYTTLYIRSGLNPMLDEGDPETPTRLVKYLNREQYGDIPLLERRAPVWEYQIKKMYIRYFGWQFIGKGGTLGPDGYVAEVVSFKGLWGLPFLLGLMGLYAHFKRDWSKAFAMAVLFIMTGLAIVFYLNQSDPQPRERDYAFVGSFFVFAIWIGMGINVVLNFIAKSFSKQSYLRTVAITLASAIIFAAVPLNLFLFNFESHDRTGNYAAWDYSYNILQGCEPDAILFTNGDNDTFPIWYLQHVEGIRPDVRVVCLALLNTPWYIKQLRDLEPKIPIKFTNAEIERLQPMSWPEPKTIRIGVSSDSIKQYLIKGEDNIQLSLEETTRDAAVTFQLSNTDNLSGHPAILVQDRMVLHIIAANKFRKPVYFSITVARKNMLGLDNSRNDPEMKNYLRMDGMAYKVMPYGVKGNFISPVRMERNLIQKFKFRNLNNPDVYYNKHTMGLLQNYRSVFLNLANYYQSSGFETKVADTLDRMNEFIPEDLIPHPDYRRSLTIGQMYYRAGRQDELLKRLDGALQDYDVKPNDKLAIASFYTHFFQNDDKAEKLALSVLEDNPVSSVVLGWLASFYVESGEFERGIKMFENWQQRNPQNKKIQNYIDQMHKVSKLDQSG